MRHWAAASSLLVGAAMWTAACGGSGSSSGSGASATTSSGSTSTSGTVSTSTSSSSASTSTSTSGASSSSSASSSGSTSSSSTSSSSTSTSSSGSMTCANLGDTCSECASVQCPAEYCKCFGDSQCVGLVLCIQNCGSDTSCDQTCFTMYPSAISESFLLGGCVADHCPVCNDSQTVDACQTCLFTSCASAMNTCIADPDCASLAQCIEACSPGDQACSMDCQTMYPAGVQKAVPVAMCMQGTCASSCM